VEQPGASSVASGRNLPVAITVGVVLAAAFLGALYTSTLAFTGIVLVLAIVGVLEAGHVLATLDPPRPVSRPVLVAGVTVLLVGAYVLGPAGQTLGLLVLLLGGFVWNLALLPRIDVVRKLGATTLLGVWVGLLASYAVLLATRPEDGPTAVLTVIGAAIFGDIGGYVFGRLLGRHRIAPTVSPNKTWEGLLGGLLLAGVLAALVLPRVGELFDGPLPAVAVALLCVLAGFVGDLAESMVKRDLGVKDLGSLLPGHGGVLDRVDGLLVALPVGYYALELLA